MDMDVRRAELRSRAQAARRKSADERRRAEELILRATGLRHGRNWLGEWHRQTSSQRLELETQMADDGVLAWRAIGGFVEASSQVVGRDPVIESAKTLLCDRYGIDRGEAFAILRHTSSRQNRKLRHVAQKIVAASTQTADDPPTP